MMLDEGRLRDMIESRTIKIGDQEHQLRLVGLCETPNNAVMLAIAIGGTDERLQVQLSEDQLLDLIALRQRVVYFAKRILAPTMRPSVGHRADTDQLITRI